MFVVCSTFFSACVNEHCIELFVSLICVIALPTVQDIRKATTTGHLF